MPFLSIHSNGTRLKLEFFNSEKDMDNTQCPGERSRNEKNILENATGLFHLKSTKLHLLISKKLP